MFQCCTLGNSNLDLAYRSNYHQYCNAPYCIIVCQVPIDSDDENDDDEVSGDRMRGILCWDGTVQYESLIGDMLRYALL